MSNLILLKAASLLVSSMLTVTIDTSDKIINQYQVIEYHKQKEIMFIEAQEEIRKKEIEKRQLEIEKKKEKDALLAKIEQEKKEKANSSIPKQPVVQKPVVPPKTTTPKVVAKPQPSKPSTQTVKNIVYPNQVYTYEIMESDIKELASRYPSIVKYKVIGKSEMGKNIYAISLGTGQSTVFINGAHHAREWISTVINMQMIEEYAKAYESNSSINNYNAKSILSNTTIWFVPMVNPDGVTLQQKGLKAFPKSMHQDLLAMNSGSYDFSRWKANIKGVDLNRQYDADWKNIKDNSGKPYYQMYKGTAPQTASEVKTIVNFTYEIKPEIAVAYHSSGRILYWHFNQTNQQFNRDKVIADTVGQMTGYKPVKPISNPSGGGYTDWFVSTFKKPGLTPELAPWLFENSPPISVFAEEWRRNKAVGLYIANEGYKLSK